MKYLVIILLTVFSISVKSQSIYTPMTAGGYQMKYLKTDSGFALPFRDTTIGRGVDRPGLMVVNPQDSLPYYYSGKLWKPVYIDSSGVIELINGKIDSITVNGNNIFYWVAGLGYGQQLNKLDSIHVSSDSIFTCIAGNCTFQYLTTAGTGTVTQIIAGFGLLPDTITASGTLAVDTSVFHTSNWNNAAYAAISHTHSASDIISGTLPIVRGGTGLSGIGAVGQELRVASSGTALEYFTPNYASQTYVDSLNSVKSLSGSYYGIISGGIVTYSGTGYTYYVSACKYMIGGVVYNSRDTSITLTAADATDPRIDLFAVDTLNRVVKITGTAAATPLTPQVDPASQIALTTGITLPPTSTTPTGTSSTLIYDENTEWTTGATATVDFNNTAQPYHGTKDAYVSAYSKNSNLTFTNGSTVTVNGQILRLFIRLNNSNYSFQVQFFNGSTAVSSIITAPVNNSLFGSYQNISIPLSSFSWSSTAFNKLVVTMTGKGGTGTYYLDYVSLESGTPIVTPPTDYGNKLDSVYLRNDSLFQYVKGVETFKGKATGGSGGTTTNSVNFNNSGTGDASGITFNGSVARTVSSNTIGAVAKADSTTAYVTPTQLAAINNHINLYKPLYGVASDTSIHVYTETDTTLNDNSDTTLPTTKAVKAYVNNHAGGGGSGSVTGGSIAWPGTLYSTPTTGSVTSGNLTFSPSLASQSAYTLFGRGSGSGTPSFLTSIDSNWIPSLHSQGYYDLRYIMNNIWSKTGTATYYNSGNVLIGTNTDDGHQLRVNGTIEFNIGSDAPGDVYYRDSLGNYTRLAAPTGFTKPVLGFASGYPKWQQDSTGGGGGGTATNFYADTITTAGGNVNWLATISGIASYYKGLTVYIPFSTGCGASPTLNINSLGAIPLMYKTTAPATNEISSGMTLELVYNGTNFQIMNYEYALLPKTTIANTWTANQNMTGGIIGLNKLETYPSQPFRGNIWMQDGVLAKSTTWTDYLENGNNVFFRTGFVGSEIVHSAITAGYDYANVLLGKTNAQPASGTHNLYSNLAVLTPTSDGTNTGIVNAQTAYFGDAPTVGALNWSINAGASRFRSKLTFDSTTTALGTDGNQTINKPSGTVNIAASGTTVTVTNSLVTATSIVYAVIRTNDATAYIKNVVPAAGSFTINLGAAATAETSIGFIVFN